MNKIILMGRLTREPEMFGQKSKVARFTLAVDRTYGEDETDFFNCVSFGKQAEFVEKYLKKGIKVLVTGKIDVYEASGSYQIYVEEMLEDGVGNLYVAFEQLKNKLTQEGLFREEHI